MIQYLIQERLLEVRPGIGTVVAELLEGERQIEKRVLEQEVEQLVVEAKRMGLEVTELVEAIEVKWAKLDRPYEVSQT